MKLLSTLILLLASATSHAAGNVSAGLKKDASKFSKNWNSANMTTKGHLALDNIYALADNIPGAKLKEDKNSVFLFLPQRDLEPAKVVQGTLERDGTLTLETFTASNFNFKANQDGFRRNDMYTVIKGESKFGESELIFSFEEIGNVKYRIKNTEIIRDRYGSITCDVVTSEKDKSVILFMGDLQGEKFKYRLEETGKVLDIRTDSIGQYLTVRIFRNGEIVEKQYENVRIEHNGKASYQLKEKGERPFIEDEIKNSGLKVVKEIIPGIQAAQSTELPKIRKKSR